MKVGDLVVRIWHGRKMWDMVGLIVDKEFILRDSGGGDWKFVVDWGGRMLATLPTEWQSGLPRWSAVEIEVISESR